MVGRRQARRARWNVAIAEAVTGEAVSKLFSGARYVVGLGANTGSPRATLRAATARIAAHPHVFGMRESPLYRTAPVGPAQPDYINGAATFRSDLLPEEFLAWLQQVERELGRDRRRETRFGPRSLDLDILHSSAGPHSAPSLTVPHPRLMDRAFALLPMLDVAPDLRATYADAITSLADDRETLDAITEVTGEVITASGALRDELDVIARALSLTCDLRVPADHVHGSFPLGTAPVPLAQLELRLDQALAERPAHVAFATLIESPGGLLSIHWIGASEGPDPRPTRHFSAKITRDDSTGRVRVDLSTTA